MIGQQPIGFYQISGPPVGSLDEQYLGVAAFLSLTASAHINALADASLDTSLLLTPTFSATLLDEVRSVEMSGLLSLTSTSYIGSANALQFSSLIKLTADATIASPNGISSSMMIGLTFSGEAEAPREIRAINALLDLTFAGDVSKPANAEVTALLTLTIDPFSIAVFQQIDDEITWSLNTATGGHSVYTNFNFNSFARIGNNYYGFSKDGIFILNAATDDGTRIDWSVLTGISSFDTFSKKYVHDARITMRANGDVALKEIVDEQTDRSNAIIYSDERQGLHARRVKLPKGISGTEWQFGVSGEGVTADIKELSVSPLVSQRTQ